MCPHSKQTEASHSPAAADAGESEQALCPVDEAARIIGQKWTLQILHHLLDCQSRRFCELQEILGGVNPSTLSSRLKMLEEEGLVRRLQVSSLPPHVEYSLTDKGCELRKVIAEITRWSNTWLCNRAAEDGQATQNETLLNSELVANG